MHSLVQDSSPTVTGNFSRTVYESVKSIECYPKGALSYCCCGRKLLSATFPFQVMFYSTLSRRVNHFMALLSAYFIFLNRNWEGDMP